MTRRIRCRNAAPRQLIAAAFLLAASTAAPAQETKIYRSYDASGNVPTFSDRPINRSSHVFAVFDGTRLWPRSGGGPVSLPQLAARRKALEPLVRRAASAHGLHAGLLQAIIEVESGFNANARSPKGAIGLMQVMPATAARYGDVDLYSAEQNVDVGARYLRDLVTLFKGDIRLAVAAYNAGENAVIRNGHRIPAYAETMRYVPMVMERYDRYRSQLQ
ncbi:lytic transglycosylase domain-containing protein [Noviherbaspirillum galbum]|uniref:Lytic transglycosylase domain-containing protein n=1 Tax=Noviherbaspirillum galbum TaxID=2709383 RepID=A0A6B3SV72_9BURK|nr:lytic transglycosylase domain-containing protein [Noviherbaspirillum galbum]NEX63285.1 lytic transglycosylase domain-containing protein [Noviherbaspirillum galbum]